MRLHVFMAPGGLADFVAPAMIYVTSKLARANPPETVAMDRRGLRPLRAAIPSVAKKKAGEALVVNG
jgi:hypothetical protein